MWNYLNRIVGITNITKSGNIIRNLSPNGIFGASGNSLLTPSITYTQNRGVKSCFKKDAAEKHRIFNFSKEDGKRTNCDIVLKQFYRLHWGAWIRRIRGHSKLWHRQTNKNKRINRQHVFCNSNQSYLLDKLTTGDVKRRHYYVDDPYEPYHSREEFLFTRKRPLPPT